MITFAPHKLDDMRHRGGDRKQNKVSQGGWGDRAMRRRRTGRERKGGWGGRGGGYLFSLQRMLINIVPPHELDVICITQKEGDCHRSQANKENTNTKDLKKRSEVKINKGCCNI